VHAFLAGPLPGLEAVAYTPENRRRTAVEVPAITGGRIFGEVDLDCLAY
jgi:hypothetical protein